MTPGPLLTTSPLPGFGQGVLEATPGRLPEAAGLLVPHDGGPVADMRDRPDRWARLSLLSDAVRRGVPVLAWGTGAALAGRVLGARVWPGDGTDGAAEWTEAPRGAVVELWRGALPLLWRAERITAWAGVALPGSLREEFLTSLTPAAPRRPGTPLEALGGEAALRPMLADFYARARADELLGPVFEAHVADWEANLDHVTAFWVTMLGGGAVWRGNLNGVHAGLGIRGAHLTRWLALFGAAASAHFPAGAAALLISRAEAMGARLGQRAQGNRPHVRRVP
ncbi:globin [Deinococcus phoenicis]|uniref:Globin n=1 Tax=Deinococcus phoenicis TaxID=1476583 RepID=A0A016QMS6_9DEIO|nr:group III truncated hemoglobin [Deinococcus phoenicis]EYB67187.1 globin [Deinococcus phoenicis]